MKVSKFKKNKLNIENLLNEDLSNKEIKNIYSDINKYKLIILIKKISYFLLKLGLSVVVTVAITTLISKLFITGILSIKLLPFALLMVVVTGTCINNYYESENINIFKSKKISQEEALLEDLKNKLKQKEIINNLTFKKEKRKSTSTPVLKKIPNEFLVISEIMKLILEDSDYKRAWQNYKYVCNTSLKNKNIPMFIFEEISKYAISLINQSHYFDFNGFSPFFLALIARELEQEMDKNNIIIDDLKDIDDISDVQKLNLLGNIYLKNLNTHEKVLERKCK